MDGGRGRNRYWVPGKMEKSGRGHTRQERLAISVNSNLIFGNKGRGSLVPGPAKGKASVEACSHLSSGCFQKCVGGYMWVSVQQYLRPECMMMSLLLCHVLLLSQLGRE